MTSGQHSSLSSSQLKHVNDLTRLSVEPGNLDYRAYRTYLIALGHVRLLYAPSSTASAAAPHITALQINFGDRIDNKTDFRADQGLWSQDKLPDIIYFFDKPVDRFSRAELKEPPKKTYDIYGARLRDIPILPDHISSKVEGWRVEAWMRFDSRLNLQDIMDRMPPDMRPAGKNVVQMRSFRFRNDCSLLGWVVMGRGHAEKKAELADALEAKGIDSNKNSTRGLSWGLINVSLGEAGGRIVVPDHRRVEDTVDFTSAPLSSMQSVADMAVPEFTSIMQTLQASFEDPTGGVQPQIQQHSQIHHRPQTRQQPQIRQQPLPEFSTINMIGNTSSVNVNPTTPDHVVPATRDLSDPFHDLMPPPIRDPVRSRNVRSSIPTANRPVAPSPTPASGAARSVVADTTPPTTVTYFGKPLTLKSPVERRLNRDYVAALQRMWYAVGSDGRREQLAYILDPAKLAGGFVDNRGFHQPIGGDVCIEADIIYGCERRLRGE